MVIRIVVSLVYVGVLILFALRARKQTRNIEDYYVGGRGIPTVFVVLSFYATFVSTNSFIGHSAKSYIYGASWMIVGAVLMLLALLSWLVIAPRFRAVAGKLGSVVPSDLFRLHFRSRTAGAMAATIILFDSVFFLAAVFLGASESMAALLGIPFALALPIVVAVQLAYTSVGGYLADVWSDSVQAVILFVGAIAVPVALVAGAGGWSSMQAELRALDAVRVQAGGFSLLRISMAAPLLLITGIGLSGGLKLVADPRQLSRFYALRSRASARMGAVWIAAIVGVTYAFLLPIGLLSRAYDLPPDVASRTDSIVPWFLANNDLLGPVLGAVILTALLAAAMSTIDSVLLVAGAALQQDILPLAGARGPSGNVATARKIIVIYALLPAALAVLARLHPRLGFGIVELTVFAGALYAAAFLPALVGILYWPRSSASGAMMGMGFGVAATAGWRFIVVPIVPRLAEFPEVFVGVCVGTAVFVLGSILRPGSASRT